MVSVSVAALSVAACTTFTNFEPAPEGKPETSADPTLPIYIPVDTSDASVDTPMTDAGPRTTIAVPNDAAVDAAPADEVFPGCVGLTLDRALDVVTTELRASAPLPRGGGPIPDGLYVLTTVVTYLGPNAETSPASAPYRGAMLFSNHGRASRSVWSIAPTRIVGAEIAYGSTFITSTPVCPMAGSARDSYYSSAGSELTFITGLPGDRTMVSTYTRL